MSLADALARLSPPPVEFPAGHVWLAGAGPGSAGSLTLDVVAALDQADHVVYDALVDPGILRAADPGAAMHFMGKRGGQASAAQDDITALMIRLALGGGRVLRLKGGDPFIFGRGGEEALALAQAGIPFRVLPGITAALGAMAHAGIPTTMRGINKAIILATGHGIGLADDLDWAALARTGQPIVVYMGLKNLPRITEALIGGGLAATTPAALVMAATTDSQRILIADLGTLAGRAEAEGFGSPALIVVGGIVALRQSLLGGAGS